jgi:hypothetical protein
MSESIAEMVIPGTYIEVRAEGLIAVGAIATGNIGIVGTAARGPVEESVAIGSYAEAIDAFGAYDAFTSPAEADHPLTLVRALEQAYGGGAGTVHAVRVANGDPTPATFDVTAAGNQPAFTLTAADPGTWGRAIRVLIKSETVGPDTTWHLTLTYRNVKETFSGANVGEVHDALAASRLVTVDAAQNAAAAFEPQDTALQGGSDGAAVTSIDVARGLDVLENQTVNILVVAGEPANTVGNAVLGHLERTENEGRERIAILGARGPGSPSSATDVQDDAAAVSDDRVVLCAPGIRATDAAAGVDVTLPPAYLAAAVAGKLATLAPHISLTNKGLPVTPDVRYSSALVKALLESRVLLVRQKIGVQVVKGITTSPKPFDQISIRRTVDYAKAGVRSGSDPYIGRLNNTRVRAALKATLDGFLSQMVLDEMLISYDLDVTATRPQEIRGIASVVMTLRPTFSIDFIRVTMNLE